jgi:hypothetical protein
MKEKGRRSLRPFSLGTARSEIKEKFLLPVLCF